MILEQASCWVRCQLQQQPVCWVWPPQTLQHCSALQFNSLTVYIAKCMWTWHLSPVSVMLFGSCHLILFGLLTLCSSAVLLYASVQPCIATSTSCPSADSFVSEPMWVLPCRVTVYCRPVVLQCSYLCWFHVPICVQLYNTSAVTAVIGIRMNDNLPFALLFCDYKGFTNGYIVESQLTIIDSQQNLLFVFIFWQSCSSEALYCVWKFYYLAVLAVPKHNSVPNSLWLYL